MNYPKVLLFCFALAAVLLPGCGESPKSYTVDVNGYVCGACQAKFYTTGGVNAQQCPECKDSSVMSVLSYTCAADNAKTISIPNREGARCQTCGALATTPSNPAEADLQTWGAVKKSKSEVGTN